MPRRVYTYPAGLGWDTLNLVSTVGAFTFALGVAVVLVDLLRNLRPTLSRQAGNVWGAGTLEWLENDTYASRSIPVVRRREPLWDQPGLPEDVEAGRYYLPGAPTGHRETIITSPIEAEPQYVARLPGPGWSPVLAAVFTAAFFLLLTVKLVTLATICGLLAIVSVVAWMWSSDPAPVAPVDIGGGVRLPTYASGALSHSWWAMVVIILVAAALYLAYVFSYLYLWTVSPQAWPRAESPEVPAAGWALACAALLLVGDASILAARRALSRRGIPGGAFVAFVVLAAAAVSASLALEISGHWLAGLRPDTTSYAAMVYLGAFLQFELVLPLIVMACFVLARLIAGRLDRIRRATFDNLVLLWHYTVAQGLLGLLLLHGFPRLIW
jgi:cytochrome c oxidase subunit I+III